MQNKAKPTQYEQHDTTLNIRLDVKAEDVECHPDGTTTIRVKVERYAFELPDLRAVMPRKAAQRRMRAMEEALEKVDMKEALENLIVQSDE
jgi:hypothetical protein